LTKRKGKNIIKRFEIKSKTKDPVETVNGKEERNHAETIFEIL